MTRRLTTLATLTALVLTFTACAGSSRLDYPPTRKVDHVDTYIGRGWALDSSSTPGGVTIMWVGRGWYREHFRFGRRILPN